MFRLNKPRRPLSSLLCLVTATCAAVVPPGSAAQSCAAAPRLEASGQNCSAIKKVCCCAPADKPRVCQCHRKSPPPEQEVPLSKPAERELTWTHSSTASAVMFAAADSAHAISIMRSSSSLRVQLSAQTVFCNWRI